MADSANTYTNMMPIFKEAYAKKAMATHKKPGKFETLKEKLKVKK